MGQRITRCLMQGGPAGGKRFRFGALDKYGDVVIVNFELRPEGDPVRYLYGLRGEKNGVLIYRCYQKYHRAAGTFCGGPLDGQEHDMKEAGCLVLHIDRGRWAAYRQLQDQRALFVGYATNQTKAIALLKRKRRRR